MSLDTSVHNVGDYYAAHYLDSQFRKDVEPVLKEWRSLGSESPARQLASLSDTYFKAKSQALEFDHPGLRSQTSDGELAAWHGKVLLAMGYNLNRQNLRLPSVKAQLPIILRLSRHARPWLVVVETPFCLPDASIPADWLPEVSLDQTVAETSDLSEDEFPAFRGTWLEALTQIFCEEDAPRWTMLLSGSQIQLFDKHTWGQGRYLRFDLDDAYGRREHGAFEAIALLSGAATLAPESQSEEPLHAQLSGQSHRFTHGVSKALQSQVRLAITAIANAWVEDRRNRKLSYLRLADIEPPFPNGKRDIDAEILRHEALVYVYRLLFCLYAEAHGSDLGALPINDNIYRLGYSMEALRDLADTSEPGVSSENGTYYQQHLTKLFTLIHEGLLESPSAPSADDSPEVIPVPLSRKNQLDMFGLEQQPLELGSRREHLDTNRAKHFAVQPLTATLFDPASTALLNRACLPNRVLQQVIRWLSMGVDERTGSIGRIDYGNLGVVQLGAVYEGLLAWKGFFATEDLIQVCSTKKGKKAADDDDDDESDDADEEDDDVPPLRRDRVAAVFDDAIPSDLQTWFVPEAEKVQYRAGEIIIERRTRIPRVYKRGEFILHLNGVDRVETASYYTPEVLTEALVSEVLAERLKDISSERADEILTLTLCEPAMGSAAFINEATKQLAHAYLECKQKVLGKKIDPDRYDDEHRRVRHWIATRNVYGVDLNPTAVELGALSLWLGSMHGLRVNGKSQDTSNGPDLYKVGAVPWFGLRLRSGNSLIGARRAVWTMQQLAQGNFYGKNAVAPRQLAPGEARSTGEIYHFLVWDSTMVPAANDKLMKKHWRSECEIVSQWRKNQVNKKWTHADVSLASALSQRIDELWVEYTRERHEALEKTACTASVWPTPSASELALRAGPTLIDQEGVKATLESQSGPFQRLKLAMDTWCGMWFWPLDWANELPSRSAWLASMELLLETTKLDGHNLADVQERVGNTFDVEDLYAATIDGNTLDAEEAGALVPWFRHARNVLKHQPFHHWELVFPEALGPAFKSSAGQDISPAGFDLIFGNPPWLKIKWDDAPLLAEWQPQLGVRVAKSNKYNAARTLHLESADQLSCYRERFTNSTGVAAFLKNRALYPSLTGVQTNVYKNFIERSWGLLSSSGLSGLLHPEGVFTDPKGGKFREQYFSRLRVHYQFKNQLMLFSEIRDRVAFSINICTSQMHTPRFRAICNLFHPSTIRKCLSHSRPEDPIPRMKNHNDCWDLSGHCDRILDVTLDELMLFSRLFEKPGTPASQARLLQVHSRDILVVLKKFADVEEHLNDIMGHYLPSEMFHESNSQREGIITRQENPSFRPQKADEWVVCGPHFTVGSTLNKTARTRCHNRNQWDEIDASTLPETFLPASPYRPGDAKGNLSHFVSNVPEWPMPSLPGFWPVCDFEVPVFEALLGEPLKRFSFDRALPGASAARYFGYFVVSEGDIEQAVSWLSNHEYKGNCEALPEKFDNIILRQDVPDAVTMLRLPKPLTAYFRYANRRRGQTANERTLIPTVLAAGASHLDAVFSIAFVDTTKMVKFVAMCSSILADFFVRLTGKGDCRHELLNRMPTLDGKLSEWAMHRIMRLLFLTRDYAALWDECFSVSINTDCFASSDDRLNLETRWGDLPERWEYSCPFRSDLSRRQALVEIDVLVALSLHLDVNELITVYQIQFPVMRGYELKDLFDSCGRRLPISGRRDPGAGEFRDALKRRYPDMNFRQAALNHQGEPITATWSVDSGRSTVTRTFHPPFTSVDREEDYRIAYSVFLRRLSSTTVNGDG